MAYFELWLALGHQHYSLHYNFAVYNITYAVLYDLNLFLILIFTRYSLVSHKIDSFLFVLE